MITPEEALQRLRAGNDRFVTARDRSDQPDLRKRREEVAGGQEPFAIVLGCSDSRVPAELIFDQGLGDLFVIRVAGNIVAPSLVDSVEFAATQFGTRLVVVLGHSSCGAVGATLAQLLQPEPAGKSGCQDIISRVRPAIEGLLSTDLANDPVALGKAAIRANVQASVRQLREDRDCLQQLVADGQLQVIGAEYCLETGVVEFLDE